MNKAKQKLHYRKSIRSAEGSPYRRCKFCRHKQVIEIKGISGTPLGHGQRCEPIGLENSRNYSIADDYVCDKLEVKA